MPTNPLPKGGFIPNWKLLDYYSDDQGLTIGVYEKESANETVIAFRGTNIKNPSQFLKNMYTHIQIILGYIPDTVATARRFVLETRQQRGVFQRIQNLISTGSSNQLYLTGYYL